jgi:predicted transcriptional regulator of viral defense system
MGKGFLQELLRLHKSIFSFKELMLLWQGIDAKTAASRVSYYVKKGQLYHVRRGIYAIDKNYDRLELAVRILKPSYISFETVLLKEGINFQYYERIFLASYKSVEIECDSEKYEFKTLKRSILNNNAGIENKGNYSIASPERAFLDVLYINQDYHFDNLSPIKWEKVYELLPIYGKNKRMAEKIKIFHDAVVNDTYY